MLTGMRFARRFRGPRDRPRVVMLVKSGLAHSAHVRKTAASLDRAGYEVFVLGAVRNEGSPSGWKQEDGFRSRVVAAPELAPSRRAERGGGLRRRALRWRHDRLRRAAERARETAKRDRAEAKARRQLEDPLNLRRYEAAWWPLVRELRPDVVHAFDVSGMGVARRAKRLGARFLYEAHEPKRHVADTEREEAERRQAVLYAAEADALIAVTEPLAEVLVEQLGLPQPPPLVHCTPVLDPGEPPPWGLREAAGVGEDTPLLVFAGLLARRRRTEVVLEAMTLLPDVHFALVVREDDPLTVELLGRGRELGVAERVHVVPKVPPRAVSPFIAAADVGVIPYNRSAG